MRRLGGWGLLLVSIWAFQLMASTPGIGVAIANGTFQVNSSQVNGNATIFEGNSLETLGAPSTLRLNSGVRIRLDAGSQSRVYHDRALLEHGSGTFDLGSGFQVHAGTFQVSGSGSDSSARVSFRGAKTVQIAALAGPVQVKNPAGLLLANVPSGEALEFTPPAGEQELTKLTGTIHKQGAKFVMEDETSKVQVEVRGPNVAKYAGKRVHVAGHIKGTNGASVLQVSEISVVTAAAGAGAAAGAAGASGTASGAIMSGVVVAGAGASAGAAITHSANQRPQPVSPSRP